MKLKDLSLADLIALEQYLKYYHTVWKAAIVKKEIESRLALVPELKREIEKI